MAKLTGGGFTNLPGRPRHAGRQARAIASRVLRARGRQPGRRPLRVRARRSEGEARSAAPARCSARSASIQPFYSYHLSTLTQTSPELGKTFRTQMLTLTTDLEGSSEVGGLFLHPDERAGGLGLAARAQPLSVHQAAPRPLRRPHARRASRGHGRSRQLALLGRDRRALLRHDLPRSRRVQRRPRHPDSSPT